jgi:hypothetical protein
MLEELEEAQDVKLFDKAKAENGTFYSLDEAFEVIEQERGKSS